ncbi:MAG: DNA polymerase beta superfamily protein, partial [Methanosarcinales archaeon]
DGFKYHINYNCNLYALFQHYISMARANYHKYIESKSSPNKKKFKHVVRALLCAKYITLFHSIPPENIMVVEYFQICEAYAYKYACGDVFLLNSEEEKIKKIIEYIQRMFDELEKVKRDVLEDRDRKIDYELVNHVIVNNIRYYGYASLSELGIVT